MSRARVRSFHWLKVALLIQRAGTQFLRGKFSCRYRSLPQRKPGSDGRCWRIQSKILQFDNPAGHGFRKDTHANAAPALFSPRPSLPPRRPARRPVPSRCGLRWPQRRRTSRELRPRVQPSAQRDGSRHRQPKPHQPLLRHLRCQPRGGSGPTRWSGSSEHGKSARGHAEPHGHRALKFTRLGLQYPGFRLSGNKLRCRGRAHELCGRGGLTSKLEAIMIKQPLAKGSNVDGDLRAPCQPRRLLPPLISFQAGQPASLERKHGARNPPSTFATRRGYLNILKTAIIYPLSGCFSDCEPGKLPVQSRRTVSDRCAGCRCRRRSGWQHRNRCRHRPDRSRNSRTKLPCL